MKYLGAVHLQLIKIFASYQVILLSKCLCCIDKNLKSLCSRLVTFDIEDFCTIQNTLLFVNIDYNHKPINIFFIVEF